MGEITVAALGDGTISFQVSWAEPMLADFDTRLDAERFLTWLRATGGVADADGTCPPCRAHHAHGHDCPACKADLALRIDSRPLPPATPATTLGRYAVAREQARIREEAARSARDRTDRFRRHLVDGGAP